MKNVYIRVAAALLLICYCLGIIGFDVHTCQDSGRSFISMSATVFDCESVHPGQSCHFETSCQEHKHCCCRHHSEPAPLQDGFDSIDEGTCCTDDYQNIWITGPGSKDGRQNFGQWVAAAGHVCLSSQVADALIPSYHRISYEKLILPPRQCDIQALCGIWRI